MNSPTLSASAAKLRNRLPTQIRRGVALYLACLLLALVVLNAASFNAVKIPRIHNPTSSFLRVGKPVFTQRRWLQTRRSNAHIGSKTTEHFPKKIWQTWKVDPLAFDHRDVLTARTWTAKNPDYRYEVLTDDNDMTWVEQHYGPEGLDRPDIVNLYRDVNATIIKADLLRYLVMYAEGGVYADIDVEALKPVKRFVTDRFPEADVDMVIGIEIDQPYFKQHPILGPKSQSFCQWTFMAKPGLPVMLRLVENIGIWLHELAQEQGVSSIGDVHLDFDAVISGTGPSAFTAAILAEMTSRIGHPVIWEETFHDMDEAHLVAGVLVLDVEAFAAGQGHSDSGNHNSRGALVKHHYHASNWPSKHPRFRHPVFGEVERCNWDRDCVAKWDEDVMAFKSLTPDEQRQRIDMATKNPLSPVPAAGGQQVLSPIAPEIPALPPTDQVAGPQD
jgi:mannosyltransferase OCH1-like enzyme